MESFVYFSFLGMILFYLRYSNKIKELERKLKKTERIMKGKNDMPNLISKLIGQECLLKTDEALSLVGNTEIKCTILDSDNEWIKISYIYTKKNKEPIKKLKFYE